MITIITAFLGMGLIVFGTGLLIYANQKNPKPEEPIDGFTLSQVFKEKGL